MSTQRAVHRLVAAQPRIAAATPRSTIGNAIRRVEPHSAHAPFTRSYSSSSPLLHRNRSTPRPTRSVGEDAEWDKLRKSKDPFLTTLDPSTPFPKLQPNEFEINSLSFKYGLPPLPSMGERMQQYNIEQSYYDRRDARIRDHLQRLLRMKKLSKKEMLILIDQVETSHWNLSELQKAYLPETRHAEHDDQDAHRRSLQVGTGGVAYKAAYKKAQEEKMKAKEGKEPRLPTDDGSPKYGYRRDLVNMGPEHWDYLTPYMIVEPEARHLSHLDGAFKYEDRYILWEEEHRNLALAAKLQRMKMLGIPLDQAESLMTPDQLKRDHIYPNARIRRALAKHLAAGKPVDSKEFWSRYHSSGKGSKSADARLLALKEAKTVTAARRKIPEYIRRFEREQDMTEIDVGAQTILAQNLYLKQRIEQEKSKKSLLTKQQQDSAKALLGMMASRNRLALRKMYLSTRTQWESLMVERALEKKYLEFYNTVGSDFMNSTPLLKIEKEVMEVVEDFQERFTERDWEHEALLLRDHRLAEKEKSVEYTEEYIDKMEEFMEQNAELPDDTNVNAGGREWINDMIEWEDTREAVEEAEKAKAEEKAELEALDRELDSWNEFFDVQVAEELGRMLDCGELTNSNPDDISDGSIELAEKRVSQRLQATRSEWKNWKLRPQYTSIEDMYAPPADPKRSTVDHAEHESTKTDGQKIVEKILKSDPIMQASNKFKARMAPTLAALDQAEADAIPGSVLSQIGADGQPIVAGIGGTGASGAGAAGGVAGDGDEYDPSISTSGHQILDINDPIQRSQMVEHAKSLEFIPETLRAQVMDPMLSLLNEHTRNSRDGRTIQPKGASNNGSDDGDSGSGNRNEFSTINPRLGFADDDFRLYDPVLMKTNKVGGGSGESDGENGSASEDESLVKAVAKDAKDIKKTGTDILADPDLDPVYWIKEQDMKHRKKHFLDLDPFGPANTDERRDFDDSYLHLDEEDYDYKKRIDPETNYQKPLTRQIATADEETPFIQKFDLNDETQELLYLLHRSDPVKYHPRYLANKFKLSAHRVKSTLILQAIHHRMVANGVVHPLMMDYDEERALEDLIKPTMPMIHENPELLYQFLPDYRWVREDDLHRVKTEEQSIEDRFLSRGDRLDKAEQEYYAKWGAIGTEPPAEPEVQPLLDSRLMAPTRHNLVMVDTSEIPAARYAIAVRHRDGTLREPNEALYQYIRKREKGNHHFVYVKYHSETTNPM